MYQVLDDPLFLVVDLFCGAGGVTTGFLNAEINGRKLAKVIACVNHDPIAIDSHWKNHPQVKHFEEDIRSLDLAPLVDLVQRMRAKYPNALLILWASLECTNFSKAKGGQPRDADSRTLAESLYKIYDPIAKEYLPGKSYIQLLDPDIIDIENVVEFRSWGPLDENGKPVSRDAGEDFERWRREIKRLGYIDDWSEINSANLGAFTSRNRLFGTFVKPGLPVVWPEPTHAKNPDKSKKPVKKWKAVKHCLDFEDEGKSIFNRKKDLSDNTLERIYAGLLKYVAKGDKAFISKYFSGKPKSKVNSVDQPCPTITTFGGNTLVQTISCSDLPVNQPLGSITTIDHHALVQAEAFIVQRNSGDPESKVVSVDGPARTITGTGGNQNLVQTQPFLLKYNSKNQDGKHTPPSVEDPSPVVSAQGRLGLVSPQFLAHYYGNGFCSSTEEPCPTLRTKDGATLVQPIHFIDKHFGAAQNQSVEQPAGTIMPNDKHRLVEVESFIMPTNFDNQPRSIEEPAPTITADRHHTYIVNPSHGGHATSTDAPCPVIVARQDKAPLSLVIAEKGIVAVPIYDTDSEIMIKIKEFMAIYGLADVKMRMLRVHELLKIQGFPEGYQLEGNQGDQKKFIGNSVVPQVVKAWTEAMANAILSIQKVEVA